MLAYFEQRYSPRNMVLAAAGNVDFDALLRAGRAVLRRLAGVRCSARNCTPAAAAHRLSSHS